MSLIENLFFGLWFGWLLFFKFYGIGGKLVDFFCDVFFGGMLLVLLWGSGNCLSL